MNFTILKFSGSEHLKMEPVIESGKTRRLNRILKNGFGVIVPMDHGVSLGPIEGIEALGKAVSQVHRGGATGIVCHKGMVGDLATLGGFPELGLLVHLSAGATSSVDKDRKVLVGTVAVKPTPSIGLPQRSLSLKRLENVKLSIIGRHDVCIAPRALPVVEAGCAIVLANLYLLWKARDI